jgi:LacI family transcriptional regulator
MARQGRMTLQQIAEVGGVSAPTISKVLNGRADVSPATRERVLRLLREHAYVPRGATSLPNSRTHVELTFDALVTPNNLEILRGVVDAATSHGTHVAVSTGPAEVNTTLWVNELERVGRSGLIMVTSRLNAEQQKSLNESGLPLVLIDPINTPDQAVVSVGATNWAGGLAAVEHLLSLGHTRIGMLRGRESVCDTARYHGYVAALAGQSLEVDPVLVGRADFRFDPAVEAATTMLTSDRPPTAVFAANDFQALGVIEAARRLGLHVPEDVSVVGFDDTVQARLASPGLTTVRQPFFDMGVAAYAALDDLIGGREVISSRIELATTLVVRQSTMPVLGSGSRA